MYGCAVGIMPAFTKFETWVAKRNGKCFKGRFGAISDDSVNHFYRFGRNFFNFAMTQSRLSLHTRFANVFRATDSDQRWWSGPWLQAPWKSSPNSGLRSQTTCGEWLSSAMPFITWAFKDSGFLFEIILTDLRSQAWLLSTTLRLCANKSHGSDPWNLNNFPTTFSAKTKFWWMHGQWKSFIRACRKLDSIE